MDILLAEGSSSSDESASAGSSSAQPPEPSAGTSNTTLERAAEAAAAAPVLASPAVRRLARELNVDLSNIIGTGPDGRILKDDVITAAEALGAAETEQAAAAAGGSLGRAGGSLEDVALALGRAAAATAMAATEDIAPATHGDHSAEVHGAELLTAAVAAGAGGAARQVHAHGAAAAPAGAAPTRIPLRGYRRAMVRSSTEAVAVPTFHYMDEMEMDELIRIRSQIRDDLAPLLGGAKLTYLPFIVKALSAALARHPVLNVQMAPGGGELLQLHAHNIGVAMATGGGLVVPNVKGVSVSLGGRGCWVVGWRRG